MSPVVVLHAVLPVKRPAEVIAVTAARNVKCMMSPVQPVAKKPRFLFNPVVTNLYIAANATVPVTTGKPLNL